MASVETTSYPGGPPAVVVRLERSDRSQIVRRMMRWTLPLGVLFAGLVILLLLFNDRPNVFGLLAVVCIGLSGLTLLLPVMYAVNERMTAYYIDAHWMAEYRGIRRDVVDLYELESISREALLNVCLTAGRTRLLVPAASIRPVEVGRLLRAAVQVAQLRRSVHLDRSVRDLLAAVPPLCPEPGDAPPDRLPPPPRKPWGAVATGRRRRSGPRTGDQRGGPADG